MRFKDNVLLVAQPPMSGSKMLPSPSTIFPSTHQQLRESCGSAPINKTTFNRRITRCSLERCRGACCYDGVYVDDATEATLTDLVKDRAEDLKAIGMVVPDTLFVMGIWEGEEFGHKTAVHDFNFNAVVSDYPSHFNQTACVFHLSDGRCALQVLAEQDGRHPWDYKPATCWLHPLDVSPSGIMLHDEISDPYQVPEYPGYVSCTFCGRTDLAGEPAAEVLQPELSYLSGILHRDLSVELASP